MEGTEAMLWQKAGPCFARSHITSTKFASKIPEVCCWYLASKWKAKGWGNGSRFLQKNSSESQESKKENVERMQAVVCEEEGP